MDEIINMTVFEEAKEEHLEAVYKIYTNYILNSTATFHCDLITIDEMRSILLPQKPYYASYVIKQNDLIIGYALYSQHKKREGYNDTAEIAIYLSPDNTNKGIGSKALQVLEKSAKQNGIHVLVSTICAENDASIKLFEKSGYEKCAHYKEVGKKFGRYMDVVVYQKLL